MYTQATKGPLLGSGDQDPLLDRATMDLRQALSIVQLDLNQEWSQVRSSAIPIWLIALIKKCLRVVKIELLTHDKQMLHTLAFKFQIE